MAHKPFAMLLIFALNIKGQGQITEMSPDLISSKFYSIQYSCPVTSISDQ